MDRRKRKTRQAILQACLELMQKKDFQQITINEIANQADINRGTFYLHFEDKFTMLNSFEEEMLVELENIIITHSPIQSSSISFIESRYDTIIQIIQCFERNKELMTLLIQAGKVTSLQSKLKSRFEQMLQQHYPWLIDIIQAKMPVEMLIHIITSIVMTIVQYGIERQEPIDYEQYARLFMDYIVHGPAKMLGLIDEQDRALFSSKFSGQT